MREIKFRAWDNVKDKMYYLGEEENIHFEFDSIGIKAIDITEESEEFKHLEHLEYMQSTGLKDKNGTEIYEGDILSDLKKENMIKVYWDNQFAEFNLLTFEAQEGFENDIGLVHGFSELYLEQIEVVGNIFEDSDLLEGRNE